MTLLHILRDRWITSPRATAGSAALALASSIFIL